MKKDLVTINPAVPPDPDSKVSFSAFLDFILDRINHEQGSRKYFYRYIFDKFRQYPQLSGPIPVEDIGQYEDILELIVYCVIPAIENENEILWGFGKTFSPEIFYGSDAFYKLLNQINTQNKNEVWADRDEAIRIHKELKYSFILEKIYGIKSIFNKEWVHRIINADTGLYQYYRITIDRRFAGLNIKEELPDFHNYSLEACGTGGEAMKLLERQLPFHLFEGTGFTITSLTDVTVRQAIEQMGKASIDDDEIKSVTCLEHINRLLQTVVGSNGYQFGILPFFTVNQRPAILYDKAQFSVMVDVCLRRDIPKHSFSSFLKNLQHEPGIKMYGVNSTNDFFPDEIQEALRADGIQLYMSFPAYYNNQLVGVLELSSAGTETPLNEQQLAVLQPAIHHVARLLQQIVNKFNLGIENIVKDKFTNIQPSVQWKFNEVAWHYLRSNVSGEGNQVIENVTFREVYPLYGAVDIRNSTIERNKALRQDIGVRMHLLKETLGAIQAPAFEKEISEIRRACNEWLNECSGFLNGNDETAFDDFLRNDVRPLLESLSQISPEAAGRVGYYNDASEEETGIAFENRRKLETSMQLINNAINRYYEEAKQRLQDIFPCYFDKFRTDGVEYDIYVGQSLTPKITFTNEHLRQFRSWQVQSMATLAQMTNALLPMMPVQLETTQLLFVHSGAIDISFRNDERRFDVEGSYNIRYQIIKKRIDKVNIRGTDQRLTQPDKIAIVYFNREDADEYLSYIRPLQQGNILEDDLEYLDLQELQGVTGLRALRVGVRMEKPPD